LPAQNSAQSESRRYGEGCRRNRGSILVVIGIGRTEAKALRTE
jgi:hypothetical protein